MRPEVKTILMRWSTPVCATAAAIVTLALFWQATALINERAPIGSADGDNPNAPRELDDYYDQLNERVRANNVFTEAEPDGFQGQLTGILGGTALFDDDSARVGERVKGATVTAIGPDWAEIEFDGQTKRLWVFEERDTSGDDTARADARRRTEPQRREAMSAGQEPTRPSRGRSRGGRRGGSGEVPPQILERFEGRLESMSPEQRQRMIDRLPSHIAEQLE